jgi:putative transposase
MAKQKTDTIAEKLGISSETVDQLARMVKTPADLTGPQGLMPQLLKAIMERATSVELEQHLGYAKHETTGKGSGNSRNGTSPKTLKGDFGELELQLPRDRNGSFEPILVPKHQRRFMGFDDAILSLYSRGMTTRDIESTLRDLYKVDVSHTLIAQVTEGVEEEVRRWQSRGLDELYPIVWLDGIRIKVHKERSVIPKTVHVALALNAQGHKELLGLWIAETEGAKYWAQICAELRNRGVKDVFIFCVDGLKGFAEAVEATFPNAEVQSCIVHKVRASMKYVAAKDMKQVAVDLKRIYSSPTLQEGALSLEEFCQKWDEKYRLIGKQWRDGWENIIPLFGYPVEVRKAMYTTNTIESLNMVIRKAIRNRRIFPSDDSALKIIYLAIGRASEKWTMPIRDWRAALNYFVIKFGARMESCM